MTLTIPYKRQAIAASVLVAAALFGGCSAHVEVGKSPAVSKDKLAATVKQKLDTQAGEKSDSVVCDGDLPGKVGATQRCVLTVGDTKLGVTVTATAVDGDDVKFDAKVDDKPMN